MKTLLLFFICICCGACNRPDNKNKEPIGAVVNGVEVKEVVIEGCQYLIFGEYTASSVTHKGNCNNPIHFK